MNCRSAYSIISRTYNGLILSQYHYVEKVLDNFFKDDNSIMKTSMKISVYLSKNKGEGIDQLEYCSIIRSLMYLMNYTSAYLISKLSRFTSNPSMDHWKAIKKVLKYLRYNLDHRIHHTGYPTILEGYINANWISDTKNSKSTSGYFLTFDGVVVS